MPPRSRPIIPSRAISRVDRRRIHGWEVQLKRQGRPYIALFHDHQYGGRAGARRAAQAWFLEALRRLPPPLRTSSRDVRCKTGQVGISLQHQVRPDGGVYSAYRAVWPIGHGRYKKRAFSIIKFGKRKAFQLALLARQQGLAQLKQALRDTIDLEIQCRTARQRTRKLARRSRSS